MKNSPPLKQEVDDVQLIKDINQLERIALGEGAVSCLVCSEEIPEGSAVAVYAFRSAGASRWRVGHCKCGDHRSQATENFTVGVRELVVDGRVGRVTDEATGSDWPVLLAVRVRAVSPAGSSDVVDVRGRPPGERKSRLARGRGPANPVGEPEPSKDQGDDSSRDGDEPVSGQLTFDELAVDGSGEGSW